MAAKITQTHSHGYFSKEIRVRPSARSNIEKRFETVAIKRHQIDSEMSVKVTAK
jgi:hypothetical protein